MCVFVDCSSKKNYEYQVFIYFSSKSYVRVYFFIVHKYMYEVCSSGSKHALRKTAYLPNRTSIVTAVYLRRKLTLMVLYFFVVLLPNHLNAFFNPKNASETNAINITPPSTGQLEKLLSSRATVLFNIELRQQCQALKFPRIQASNGAVKHEHSNEMNGSGAAE